MKLNRIIHNKPIFNFAFYVCCERHVRVEFVIGWIYGVDYFGQFGGKLARKIARFMLKHDLDICFGI